MPTFGGEIAQRTGTLAQVAERARSVELAGQWRSAREEFSHLFALAVAQRDLGILVDALRGAARSYQRQELYEEAEELTELSREIAERNGLLQAAARATNNLAVIRHLQRDWDGAQALYQAAFDAALDVGDDALLAWTTQNLGILANLRGDLHEARLHYLESVAASVRSGDGSTAAIVYNNLGKVCCYLSEWLEALLYFDRGIEIAHRLGHTELLGKLHSNRAEPLIGLGELDRAHRALNNSEPFAATVVDYETLADIARFRGMAAVQAGDFATAEEHFGRSLALVREAGLLLEHAQLLEELAKLRWKQGRREDALTALREAHEKFVSLSARWNVERAEALLTEWEASAEHDSPTK